MQRSRDEAAAVDMWEFFVAKCAFVIAEVLIDKITVENILFFISSYDKVGVIFL